MTIICTCSPYIHIFVWRVTFNHPSPFLFLQYILPGFLIASTALPSPKGTGIAALVPPSVLPRSSGPGCHTWALRASFPQNSAPRLWPQSDLWRGSCVLDTGLVLGHGDATTGSLPSGSAVWWGARQSLLLGLFCELQVQAGLPDLRPCCARAQPLSGPLSPGPTNAASASSTQHRAPGTISNLVCYFCSRAGTPWTAGSLSWPEEPEGWNWVFPPDHSSEGGTRLSVSSPSLESLPLGCSCESWADRLGILALGGSKGPRYIFRAQRNSPRGSCRGILREPEGVVRPGGWGLGAGK